MCSRGVWQLKSLMIQYCKFGGASHGVRQFLDKSLVSFAENNPQLQILVSARPNKDPIARGWYVQDRSKTLSLRNLSSLQVMEQLQTLRNSRPLPFRKNAKVFRTSASVQGKWELGMLLPRPHRTLRG